MPNICFAKRGNKSRNLALRHALEKAERAFAEDFGFCHPANNDIISSTPPITSCLQAVDYYLWALQRFYERREERFLELIWQQVGEVHDLDMVINGRRGSIYTKQKPLTLETAGAAFKNK